MSTKENNTPIEETQIEETNTAQFVLANDGSICLPSEVKAINAKIKKAKDDAEAELKAREEQAKKNK